YKVTFGPAESDIIESLFESDIEWMPDNYTDFRPSVNYYAGLFGGHLVVDENYREDDFLLGDYYLDNMPDMDKIRELHDFLSAKNWYWKEMGNSYASDFHGTEDYLAVYIMPQIELFNKLTFIPGIRYERNQTEYTAWRIPYLEETRYQPHPEIANFHVTRKRENEFFLPMIHCIYRPSDWFDIKTSYTHTLSRPRFGDFVPKWKININSLTYNNPYLEPALSKNIDLHFSFYGNKLGLFTIGAFNKTIEDLVFDHGTIPLNQLGTAEEVTEMFDGLPGVEVIGSPINWTMNNPRNAVLQGIELEWQCNFWYLPGLLKGLVLNVNFTMQSSENKYPIVDKSQIIVGYDTTYVFGQEFIKEIRETVYTDTFYTDRMIDQANELLNLSLGYDYKGFSIRASMKYTDNLFRSFAYYDPYREFTTGRYDYDIAIRQKLPLDGMQVYCNLTNLSKTRNITINQGSGWPTNQTYGGLGIAFGLKYEL
ncbi:MAG: TonB-dependent receptor, partial [bacterium]